MQVDVSNVTLRAGNDPVSIVHSDYVRNVQCQFVEVVLCNRETTFTHQCNA